jgi:CubicO group peptidase (beta-lactamase class C family)
MLVKEGKYLENLTTRAGLIEDIAQLPLSRGLRECFQYRDLTVNIAGHVAEITTGRSWELLVQERMSNGIHRGRRRRSLLDDQRHDPLNRI